VIILPEGRMRRANGLDRHNTPTTARGGVVQIMEKMRHLFKTIRIQFELLEISEYLAAMRAHAPADGLKGAP
jgi:hypothetical protein